MRLSEMVTVIANNEDCVLLKVKEECRLDLITLGTFTLTDDMFRLTKGKNHTITNFSTNGNSFSYDFGESGHTIISDSLEKEKELILECVENDFDIYIGSDPHKIKKSLNIFTLDDKKHSIHTIDVMYWAKHPEDLCVHKDGEFYKFFKGKTTMVEHFKSAGGELTPVLSDIAPTGCYVDTYYLQY